METFRDELRRLFDREPRASFLASVFTTTLPFRDEVTHHHEWSGIRAPLCAIELHPFDEASAQLHREKLTRTPHEDWLGRRERVERFVCAGEARVGFGALRVRAP